MNKFIKIKSKKFNPMGVILFLLVVAGIAFFRNMSILPKLEEAEFVAYEQEIIPYTNPSKLVVSEKGIAVFYENAGYTAFYSLNGLFMYGIQVDTSDKGTGNIAFLDDLWVIYSKNNTVYFFSDKTLVEKFHVSTLENYDLGKAIKERMGDYSSLYCSYDDDEYWVSFSEHPQVKKRMSSGEETTLILLPTNNFMTFLFALCLFLCLGAMFCFISKDFFRKNEGNSIK